MTNTAPTQLRTRTAALLAATVELYEGTATTSVDSIEGTFDRLRVELFVEGIADDELDQRIIDVKVALTRVRNHPTVWDALARLVSDAAALHDAVVDAVRAHRADDRELVAAC